MLLLSAIILSAILAMPMANAKSTNQIPIKELNVKKVIEIEALKPAVYDYEHFCVDAQGLIYFLDIKNNCVLVYDDAGKYMRQISQIGQDEKDLFQPRAIYVHGDRLYILDALGTSIKKFATNGAFIESIIIPRANSTNSFALDKDENIFTDTVYEESAGEGNNGQLISLLNGSGKVIRQMGKAIEASHPMLYKFENTCLLAHAEKGRIVGAFAYKPIIFSYDKNGLEAFYVNLGDGSIEEISLLDDTLKDLRKTKPEFSRNGRTAKITGVQYFFGIAIDNKSEILLTTNRIVADKNERRGIVIRLDSSARPIERFMLRADDDYVEHIRRLWIMDQGERYALAYIKKVPWIIKF